MDIVTTDDGWGNLVPSHSYNVDRDYPYKTILVLFFSWEDDDLGIEDYIQDLKTVFGSIYNFPTYWFRIPLTTPKEYMEERVEWFKAQYSDQRELLLVYYGGHGQFQGDDEMTLSAYKYVKESKDQIPILMWDDLLAAFETPKNLELLFLMDCCFAAGSIRNGYLSNVGGTIEVIAACGFETESYGGASSFTHALIEELIQMNATGTEVFSTLDLHMGVLKRILDRRPYSRQAKTPVFMRLRQNHFTEPSVLLKSFAKGDADTDSIAAQILEELEEHDSDYRKIYGSITVCECCGGTGNASIHGNADQPRMIGG